MNTFTIEGFATGCKQAMTGADDRCQAAKKYLEQTMAENDPGHIVEKLEAAIPADADIGEMIVHTSPELTMLYARVPPHFQSGIHNHTVFACIGQLVGTEVSTVYAQNENSLDVAEVVSANAGEVISLPEDAIHHIENPNDTTGSSLHIYGGDFYAVMDERSLWSFDDHEEKPFSFKELIKESIKGMQMNDNQTGLDEIARAIPSTKPLIDAYAEHKIANPSLAM
jgi:predicted metal-dependent enzyme (double-stranded beta helix superfamily)